LNFFNGNVDGRNDIFPFLYKIKKKIQKLRASSWN